MKKSLFEQLWACCEALRGAVATASLMCVLIISPGHAGDSPQDPRQQISYSRYGIYQGDKRVGWTEVTEFRRTDGSRSYLVAEHQEIFGPVLDRFMIVTLDPEGRFDSGHWVATSQFSRDFDYAFHFDGRAIRGEWEDTNRGHGRADVPTTAGTAVVGFWGYPESLILARFAANGPNRQTFEAVNVEDNLHRQMTIVADRLGPATIEVPAGRFQTTSYRVDRFDDTHHWIDAKGVLVRWSAEEGRQRWDLEQYPSPERTTPSLAAVASGTYEVSDSKGKVLGTIDWSLGKNAVGELVLLGQEQMPRRRSQFQGRLDGDRGWLGSSEIVQWPNGLNAGPPAAQYVESFFYRDKFHLTRFIDRAYPYRQSRKLDGKLPFHLVNYPVAAAFWLDRVKREVAVQQTLPQLAVLENNYWGTGAEVQQAKVTYLGRADAPAPSGTVPGHNYQLSYAGGWHDFEFTYWTDERLVPMRVREGKDYRNYRLVRYEVTDPKSLPAAR